jgi:catechol 2,3-dioxygenase-like lactoylglutathione lyase family enzyme
LADLVRKVDAIGIPSSDAERSREFYVETLGLRPDESPLTLHTRYAPYGEPSTEGSAP